MNYNKSSPKVLKFLVSNGDLIDESGNVITHSDSLEDIYIKASPQVKKYLLSDGSVVDENNNLIIKNDYFKKVYDQAEPIPAKYLHADGTIDENSGSGGGTNLQNNKTDTIDVSNYSEPVEIEPDSGFDGMKKATITLSNIPQPSSGGTLYAWYDENHSNFVYTLSENPSINDKVLYGQGYVGIGDGPLLYDYRVTSFNDGVLKTSYYDDYEYIRDSGNDIVL